MLLGKGVDGREDVGREREVIGGERVGEGKGRISLLLTLLSPPVMCMGECI